MVLAPETNIGRRRRAGERIRTTVETSVFTYHARDSFRPRSASGSAVADDEGPTEYDRMKHAAPALSEAKRPAAIESCPSRVKKPFEQR